MGMMLARHRVEETRRMEEIAKLPTEKAEVVFSGKQIVTSIVSQIQPIKQKAEPKSRLRG